MPVKTTHEKVQCIVKMALSVMATREDGCYRLADADVETFATMIAVDVFSISHPDIDVSPEVLSAFGIS